MPHRFVLGDRSFSKPWGGSVLDSVIGTFLTQNVSDQLSSKAYMTLVARFPAEPQGRSQDPQSDPPPSPCDAPQDRQSCGSNGSVTATDGTAQTSASSAFIGVKKKDATGGQLVMTDTADCSDSIDWEAVRVAPPAQVSIYRQTTACTDWTSAHNTLTLHTCVKSKEYMQCVNIAVVFLKSQHNA